MFLSSAFLPLCSFLSIVSIAQSTDPSETSSTSSPGAVPNLLAAPLKNLVIEITKGVPDNECSVRVEHNSKVFMHYTGTLLETGAKFDSSRDRDSPLSFTFGEGSLVSGMTSGIRGACKGEKRNLYLPSTEAYGESGAPPTIPPRASLKFEVEILHIIPHISKYEEDDAAADSDDGTEHEEL